MKVMVIVKATSNSEAGRMPSEQLLAEMGKYNEELVKAGILLAGDGLHPSARGKRIKFAGGQRSVVDGPFPETKELIAGFWIWQVRSLDEAVEWARRCPDPMPGEEAELELRPIFEAEDFGEAYTPEVRAQEERLRAEGLFGERRRAASPRAGGGWAPPPARSRRAGSRSAPPGSSRASPRVSAGAPPLVTATVHAPGRREM